jgi:rSAM/selenodomain-associated transferase 1
MNATNATLLLIFKRPALEYAKQRLAQRLGARHALQVARGMLDCALEDADDWPGPVVLAPARSEDRQWARQMLTRVVSVEPQCKGNLGHRINDLDARLRFQGRERLLCIGSDAPSLDAAYYARARRALDTYDVVLGPASDGGVTLLGSAKPWPRLDDLPWGSHRLRARLAARCADGGLNVTLLPLRCDVDQVEDIAALSADLTGDARPARRRLHQVLISLRLATAQEGDAGCEAHGMLGTR